MNLYGILYFFDKSIPRSIIISYPQGLSITTQLPLSKLLFANENIMSYATLPANLKSILLSNELITDDLIMSKSNKTAFVILHIRFANVDLPVPGMPDIWHKNTCSAPPYTDSPILHD